SGIRSKLKQVVFGLTDTQLTEWENQYRQSTDMPRPRRPSPTTTDPYPRLQVLPREAAMNLVTPSAGNENQSGTSSPRADPEIAAQADAVIRQQAQTAMVRRSVFHLFGMLAYLISVWIWWVRGWSVLFPIGVFFFVLATKFVLG